MSLRSDHLAAFTALLQSLTPLDVHDSVVPLNADGTVVRESYYTLHDMGAERIDDERWNSMQDGLSARTYRYVLRSVAITPFAVREVADAAHALAGKTLIVADRKLDPIHIDSESEITPDPPTGIALVYYTDTDFTVRSRRA